MLAFTQVSSGEVFTFYEKFHRNILQNDRLTEIDHIFLQTQPNKKCFELINVQKFSWSYDFPNLIQVLLRFGPGLVFF